MSVPRVLGWSLLKSFDLRTDEGWKWTKGVPGTNAAFMGTANARFASGERGRSLTLEARRAPGKITSAEGRFIPLVIPPQFRAEVRMKVSPMMTGIWPGMRFRPNGGGNGEIVLGELFGREAASRRKVHFTIHRTPLGRAHRQVSRTFSIPADPSAQGWHTYGVEKVKNKIAFFVDDLPAATFTPRDAAWWREMFEAETCYLPMLSLQVGPGRHQETAGRLPESWSSTHMEVGSITVWKRGNPLR